MGGVDGRGLRDCFFAQDAHGSELVFDLLKGIENALPVLSGLRPPRIPPRRVTQVVEGSRFTDMNPFQHLGDIASALPIGWRRQHLH